MAVERKGPKKNSKLTLEQRMNAEFKHMKLRIRRLEEIVLNQKQDNGSILEPVEKLKKG